MLASWCSLHAAEPIINADFEGSDYGAWQAKGDAFGRHPAQGTLPGQMIVDGFLDKAFANRNMAFYESKNLRQWTRTGAFTDPDRDAVFECPEMF